MHGSKSTGGRIYRLRVLSRLLLGLCLVQASLHPTLAEAGRPRLLQRLRDGRATATQSRRENAKKPATKGTPKPTAANAATHAPAPAAIQGEFSAQGMGASGPYPTFHGGNSKNTTSATDGQVWTYDSADGKWNPENAGAASLSLDGLTDVTVSSPATKQTIRYNGSAFVNSTLASTDLSDFAATIVGTAGDLIGWSGTAWDDLTFNQALANAYGNSTDNYVLTADGAGGFAFEAIPGGSGLTVTGTPIFGETVTFNDFDDTWVPAKPGAGVFPVKAYGASGRSDISTTGTVSASSTALTLASATTFAKGNYIAIVGAGATHGIAAPSTPVINVGGTSGATTYEWGVGSFSGDGGWSAVSTTAQTTAGNATLSATNYATINWRAVANSDGFYITGRSSTQANRSVVARVNGAPNAKMVTFQASGYTNAVQTDIGKTVTRGGSTGILAGYDNTNRFWWIIPTVFGTDTFSSFGAATIGSGTGAGTSTAVEDAYSWKDTGDASVIATTAAGVAGTTQPSLARRVSTVYYPGEIIVHPIGPTGQTFICTRVEPQLGNYPTSSSTATGSLTLGTTIGTEYQDGDIFWMAVNLPMPVDEPTAAVPDLLRTQISAISGTSVTLANAAGNSVTSQTVLHDEYAAINAARTAAIASNAAATTIYFDPGLYFCILGEPDANTWSQWTATNGPFVWSTSANAHRWYGPDGAKLVFLPTSHRSNTVDSGSPDYLFRTNSGNDFAYSIDTIFAPTCEPKLIQQDGWNRVFFYGDYATGATQRVSRTLVENCDIYGFGRIWLSQISTGYGHGSTVQNCRMSWGGAGHDALLYGSFNRVLNNTFYGHETFGSDVLYTDDEASPDLINDLLVFSGNKIFKSRVNGVRLRVSKNIVTNNHWIDTKTSSDIILCDSLASGVLANNTATNGGVFRMTGLNWSIANNTLRNSQMYVVGGTSMAITGGSIYFDTNASDYFQSGAGCLHMTGGTDVTVTGMSINNAETDGPVTGVLVSSTGRTSLNGVHSYANADVGLNVTSGMSGTLNINGGQYYSGIGPQGFYLCQNASGIVTIDGGAVFTSNGNNDTAYSDNGTLNIGNAVFYVPLQLTSSVDGLQIDGAEISKGAAGTCTISVPNASITSTSFGAAPALTSITGLSRSGNRLTTSRSQAMTALAANTDNLLVGICDTLALTTSGTNNYNLTGLAGLAEGNTVTLVNAETSGADIITLKHATTSTAGNQFFLKGAVDYALDPGDWVTVQVITAGGATYYREITRGPL